MASVVSPVSVSAQGLWEGGRARRAGGRQGRGAGARRAGGGATPAAVHSARRDARPGHHVSSSTGRKGGAGRGAADASVAPSRGRGTADNVRHARRRGQGLCLKALAPKSSRTEMTTGLSICALTCRHGARLLPRRTVLSISSSPPFLVHLQSGVALDHAAVSVKRPAVQRGGYNPISPLALLPRPQPAALPLPTARAFGRRRTRIARAQ